MNRFLYAIVLVAIGYFLGMKFPNIARSMGVM